MMLIAAAGNAGFVEQAGLIPAKALPLAGKHEPSTRELAASFRFLLHPKGLTQIRRVQ